MNMTFPKYLSIQTTSLCNGHCIFCPYDEIKDLFPKKIMEESLFRKIIDECSQCKSIERIILYLNNEPLTDPYLIDRINYAKEKVPWASVHILTNGLLLTDKTTEELINSKLDWIGISFQGIRKETIEKTMSIPFEVTLERISSFIEKVKEKKNIKDYVMITFLKHKYLTYDEKEEAINFWKSKGIERISYFDGPISRAGNVKDLPRVYHKERIIGCKSIWADEMLHVVEDGKVVLCCMDWRREIILGDLNKETIYQVWNGERKNIWQKIYGQKNISDNFLCKRCEEAIVTDEYKFIPNKPDILLVNFPPWGVDNPPLGIACLSSYLRGKGISTDFFDLNIKLYNEIYKTNNYLWSMNYSYQWRDKDLFVDIQNKLEPYLSSFIEKIIGFPSDILGFSLPTNCSDLIVKEIVKRIKNTNPNKKIILGGVSISIKEQRRDLLRGIEEYVDYCVVGEGEEVLYKLISAILNDKEDKKDYEIKGVLNKKNFLNDIDPIFVKNLEDLTFPTFEEFNLNEYKVSKSLVMEFSRGCIGKCPFCDFKSISPFFRAKKASYIFNQMKFYQEKYNINHISVCDAAVNGDIKVLKEVCDLLIRGGLSINISALAIPRKEMTEDLLKKMRKAGFYRLEYGVESGANKILKAMRKIFTKEIAEKVIRDTYKAGIKTYLYFIVGYPQETKEDLNETKEFLKRNAKYITMIKSINPLYVMAGSEIFYNHKKYNIVLPLKNNDREWYIGSKNTYSIREKRILELKTLAKSLKVPFTEEAESLEFTVDFLSKKATTKKNKNEKILLVLCPMWDIKWPPLGISYLVSSLESKGVAVDVLDINIETYSKSDNKRKALWKMQNYSLWSQEDFFKETIKYFEEDINYYAQEILSKNYKIIGFSLYGANILFSIKLATILKERDPHLFIIFGGPSCWFLRNDPTMPIRYMISPVTQKSLVEPGIVDAFVIGEGEETFADLISNYLSDNIHPIPGTAIFLKGNYIVSTPRPPITELDKIPYPSWEKLPLDLYWFKNNLPILFSRGCINKCAFCIDWIIWQEKYRCRSALNIFEEMKTMLKKFNTNTFQCNDLLFNGNLKMLEELAEYLIQSSLNINWNAQGLIRKDMRSALLEKLKKGGLHRITYGVESLSDNVTKAMDKKYSFEDTRKLLMDTKKSGIVTAINLVVGFPTENKEDFDITKNRLALIREHLDIIGSLNPCGIMIDSILYRFPQKFSVINSPIRDYHWKSLGGENTYEIRERRVNEMAEFAKSIGIEVELIGVSDENDLLKEISQAQKETKKIIKKDNINILFINLPPWAQENPYIGIGYLSAYLRNKSISFKLLDLNKSFYINHPDFKMLWHVENKNFWSNKNTFPLILEIFKEDIEKAIDEILSFDCDILGFSVVDPKESLTIELIRKVKKKAPNKKIILGGPATSTYEQRRIFLDNVGDSIDVFVIGEGEETLFCLLDRFLNKKERVDIEGCYVKNNGRWAYKERSSVGYLDKIPFPTYEEFDMKLYGKSLLVEWSRGCKGRCTFCKNYRLFPTYRSKSVDWVINELRYHKERYGIEEVTVVDNILNGDINQLREICERIIRGNLKINWSGQIAPRKEMDYELFYKMYQAGCQKIQIGVESGSAKILKLMRKIYTPEIAENNIRLAKKAGMETEIFIMVGFPGEAEKEFKKTYDFIKRNAKYIDTIKSINTLHLIAGTDVYDNYEEYNLKPLPEINWHYLWETYDGNTYEIRKDRAQRLLDLAYDLRLKVMEINIKEGKEELLSGVSTKSLSVQLERLKIEINHLQELPQGKTKVRILKKKRSLFKFILLGCIFIYTLFYITYFWVFKKLRGRTLLGGS
jgi:radical SAM superfamily enzyme YgiQ (UPF0313 family)